MFIPVKPSLKYFVLALVLAVAMQPAAVAELVEPVARDDGAGLPRFLPDPARPGDAPTHLAIQSITEEDGAAAGVILATRALEASRVAYGARDTRTVVPLTNLAHTKLRAGDTDAALKDYQLALELAESAGGPRDPRLFDAWYGIGWVHHKDGIDTAAAAAFATALQSHRVNHGLYSREQLEVLHALATSTYRAGRTDDADALQVRRIEVAERIEGLSQVELAQTYISVGRWYRNTSRIDGAIRLHGLAVGMLEREKGKENPELLDPLLELATTGGLRRRDMDQEPLPPSWQPPVVLARAERLADARKNVPPAEQAQTLIRIGDVNMSLGRREPALRNYARATQMLAGLGQKPPFDKPAFLIFSPPNPLPLEGAGGFLVAEFSVNEEGRTKDIKVVESQPASLPASIRSDLASALRYARLRPVIRAGKPVPSKAERFRLAVRGDSG
ncbi:MAG: tetratricopeptide repeat protein [Panacagrimonas sp.]